MCPFLNFFQAGSYPGHFIPTPRFSPETKITYPHLDIHQRKPLVKKFGNLVHTAQIFANIKIFNKISIFLKLEYNHSSLWKFNIFQNSWNWIYLHLQLHMFKKHYIDEIKYSPSPICGGKAPIWIECNPISIPPKCLTLWCPNDHGSARRFGGD